VSVSVHLWCLDFLFYRNPKLLRALPSPLLSLATKQVAGRGRGKNAWLSPAGSMLISLKLSVPLKNVGSGHDSHSIRPSNLVFIQYLFALAVVEGCQALDPAKEWATKVKLKWPNDIYGEFPAEETWKRVELKKLGGILVNTSFGGNVADVIIGCGLNVLNEPPIGSLAQLVDLTRGQGVSSSLTVERVTAAVLVAFERIWMLFLAAESEGFRSFMDRYTSSWLHSGQTVTLATATPHTTVRIVGITPDHGLLRTEPLGGGQYIDLQPDGNSFDMLKGLIKTKTN
jgi:biotin--protein ligase